MEMIKRSSLFTGDEITKSDRSLHAPSNFAKQNLLYVQEVGTLQSLQPHKCVREKLDSFLFVVVLEGKGSMDIAGRHYDMQTGSCALVDCMEHYEHISDEQDAWKLAWVHFNGNSARSFYELFMKYNKGKNMFYISNTERLTNVIEELKGRQVEKNLLSEIACGELLMHLLYMVLEIVAGTTAALESESEKQMAGEIREFINEQYIEKNVFELLQDSFARPMPELNRIFFGVYGINIEEYISNRRYNAAKELLRFSVKSLETVAEESGIGDRIVMQQLFRENEGMSAEEYREKWAGWVRN